MGATIIYEVADHLCGGLFVLSAEKVVALQIFFANHLGTLTAPEMIAASEEADQVVLQLQKLRMLEWKSRSREGA